MTRFLDFWWGGLLTGAIAVAYPLVTGSMLGVSGVYDRLLKRLRYGGELADDARQRALLAETLAAFGPRAAAEAPEAPLAPAPAPCDPAARLFFLPGIVLGAALGALVWGRGEAWSLGAAFVARFGSELWRGAGALFAAGVLIGLGARMGGGCTSGHGISGVALGQRGSLVGTAVFWSTAVGIARLLDAVGR